MPASVCVYALPGRQGFAPYSWGVWAAPRFCAPMIGAANWTSPASPRRGRRHPVAPGPSCAQVVSMQVVALFPATRSWTRPSRHAAKVPMRPRIHSTRSEEHTSELQSLMRLSYAVFCLKKQKHNIHAENTEAATTTQNTNTTHMTLDI